MGIECTNLEEFKRAIADEVERVERLTQAALFRLGEEAVTTAKNRPQKESWYDHTGNLRSSVGYVVSKGGVPIEPNGAITNSESFKVRLEGSEGAVKGREYATQIASKLGGDYSLVVVAGMEYAQKVEDIEGKDVLATATLQTKQKFPVYMENLKRQINQS